MAEVAERVGTRMRQRREQLRLTQAEVAYRIEGKTTSDQVSRWERGRHQPNDLGPIAKALEVDVSYFYAPAEPSVLDGSGMDTPDLLALTSPDNQLAHILAKLSAAVELQNELLERQSRVLERIEARLGAEEDVRDELSDLIARHGRGIVQGLPPTSQPETKPKPRRSSTAATKRAKAHRTP